MARRVTDLLNDLRRAWFPVALGAVVLIAVPGFLLYGLSLFDHEGDVNAWMQDHFQLTYHLPFAWWVGLILLLVPMLIVLLYFLKLKRKPLSVPSTFLWRKSIEDLHVNALFQWLRQNLLLLLQLLAVLLLIYSVMDFRLHGQTAEGRHYILIIDNSASMSAADVQPDRLQVAKQEALKEIDAATDNDFGMVIEFNSSAAIRQSYTNNRGALRSAVESIRQTQKPTRIDEALSLAASLANPTRSADDSSVRPGDVEPGKERTYVPAEGIATEVHVFSDGRFPALREFELGKLNVSFHPVGKPGADQVDNVGIVTLNAVRDEQDPSKMQVFARVLNFRSKPVQAKLQLEIQVNGNVRGIQEKTLDLDARKVQTVEQREQAEPVVRDTPGEQSVTFELSDVDDRNKTHLHAKLAGHTDAFPLDDEAWLVVGVVRKARVLIVGRYNEVLRAFFEDDATRAVVNVSWLEPPDLAKDTYRKPALAGEYDLVIFDRCGPAREEDMPHGNSFFIGYPPPPWKPDTVEKITNPQIKGWDNRSPVMRYLTALQEMGIAEAFRMKDLPPRTPRLIEIDQNAAILLALSRTSYTDLVMTFQIITDKDEWNTNWPLLPSFPLFLRNVVYALGNVSDGAGEETVQPGQVKTLRPDVNVAEVDVINPQGQARTLGRGTRADFSYGETDRVGVYRVAWSGAWQRSFAVNLLDAEESNIEPRGSVLIGPEAVRAGKERSPPRELWKWLVALALGLLLAEWYIYNRRVYV